MGQRKARIRQLGAIGMAILLVLMFAYGHRDTAEPIEVAWGAMGAAGAVWGLYVALWRWDFYRWRRSQGLNGYLHLTLFGHLVLPILAFIGQLLIVVSALSTIATPPSIRPEVRLNDVITGWCLLGLGIQTTISCWFAEHTLRKQEDYLAMHPEA